MEAVYPDGNLDSHQSGYMALQSSSLILNINLVHFHAPCHYPIYYKLNVSDNKYTLHYIFIQADMSEKM